MRIVAEVTAEAYEAIVAGDRRPLEGRLEVIEVRQEGGLLSHEMPASLVEPVFDAAVLKVVPGEGPVIRLYPRKEVP